MCDDQYFGYDAMGRQDHLTGAHPSEWGWGVYRVQAGYDLAGNQTDLTYPDGTQVVSGYDGAGRLASVRQGTSQSPGPAYISSLTYSASGAPTTIAYGNSVVEHMAQNNRLQPCEINAFMSPVLGGAMFMDRQMLYSQGGETPCGQASGNNGNIWHILDNTNIAQGSSQYSQHFGYDPLNRLTGWNTASMPGQAFGYDSFGNMSPLTNGAPVYSFDATNRLSNLPCASAVTPYDASGNQLCTSDPYGAVDHFQYDGENRLSKIAVLGNEANPFVKYTYDAGGTRVRKDKADGTWTEYASFSGRLLAEKDQNGSWKNYVYANGEKVARVGLQETVFQISGTST
ncbi:MAG: RHS repeat protein, partial [Acidobacteriota bacterium]|nr:RHS repeat protein [Acidobacteriota bacterium]